MEKSGHAQFKRKQTGQAVFCRKAGNADSSFKLTRHDPFSFKQSGNAAF
jgi:hypothetical protein